MFVHLNCHTEYSLVDGLLRIDDLVTQAKKDQMPAVGITDVSNLFAMVKFYKKAIAKGVKPIIGSELYIEHAEKDEEVSSYVFLCMNKHGYKNLTELLSKSYLENQVGGKAVIKREWLSAHSEGLIIISKTINNDIAEYIAAEKFSKAKDIIDNWQQNFPQRFYLGITRTGRTENLYESQIIKFAESNTLPLVVLNDVCFLQANDFEAHEARICIHRGQTLDDQTRKREYTEQQFFRSSAQMKKLFADIPQAIENTVEIAKRCNLILDLNVVHLPEFATPTNTTPKEYLYEQAKRGLEQRLEQTKSDIDHNLYYQRLDIELQVINNMGFAGYFLIVADFIAWAFANNVPVGPGRGSGAGSLVAYALKITNIDPLQYDLLFERFLNPERVSMPDFDIDFCMEGRDRVIDYVANRYGRDSVSQIITYGTMAAKAVIRDVGRVLGFPYGFVDKIAKLIPMELGITLTKALEQEDMLRNMYKSEDDVKTLLDLALKLEGITRNVGKHAGGVVIAPSVLTNFTPLYCESGSSQAITQFDKDDVETIGLVKFDFLGLRTLTIIDWALMYIKKRAKTREEETLDISTIPLNDNATFNLLCQTNTSAVFQLESRGMKDLIRRLQPDCFEDIVALVALFRPGPLQSGMVDDFINRKRGNAAIEYPHPELEPILKATYGVILYQEQVMQIAQTLAGYTLGAADLLRRAMGKKKPEEMAKQREIFTEGAIGRGVDAKVATYIFDLMEKFAGYGFNKSHSAAYALVSYQTAWLKTHYPAEFMAAVLSADMAHTDKIVFMIDDCRNIGLKIVTPSINVSDYKFIVDEQDRIVYGLGAIKGVGEGAIENIMQVRKERGKFKDLLDLCINIDHKKVTRRTLEALIYAGALDDFGMHRAALMGNLEAALQASSQAHKDADLGQSDLFGEAICNAELGIITPSDAFNPWTDKVRLKHEKQSLGLYLSGHPITNYEPELKNIITHNIANLRHSARKEKQTIAGLLIGMRTMNTKRGDKMAFITLEDRTGRQEVAVFSDLYSEIYEILKKDELIIVQGEAKNDDYTGGIKMRAVKAFSLEKARSYLVKKIQLSINAENLANDFVPRLKEVLEPHLQGNCLIEVNYASTKAQAKISFGDEWKVKPCEKLLEELNSLDEANIKAKLCYAT